MPEKVITIESLAFKKLMAKLDNLEKAVKSVVPNVGFSKWLNEDETMRLTGLKKRSLMDKRKAGIFNISTATGRKIKYLRRDVENYLDNNSTLRPNERNNFTKQN